MVLRIPHYCHSKGTEEVLGSKQWHQWFLSVKTPWASEASQGAPRSHLACLCSSRFSPAKRLDTLKLDQPLPTWKAGLFNCKIDVRVWWVLKSPEEALQEHEGQVPKYSRWAWSSEKLSSTRANSRRQCSDILVHQGFLFTLRWISLFASKFQGAYSLTFTQGRSRRLEQALGWKDCSLVKGLEDQQMKPFATFSISMLVHGHLVSTDFPAFVCISGVAARRHATYVEF